MRYCSHPAQRGLDRCVSEPVSCEGKRRKKRGKAQPLLLATLGARPANRAPGKLVLLCVSPFFFSAVLTSSHSFSGLVGIVWRRPLHHVAAVHAWILCLAPLISCCLEPRVAGQVALPPSTAAATGRRALRTVGQVWARYSYRWSTQRRAAVGRRQTGPLVSTVMVGPRLRCKLPFRCCLCWSWCWWCLYTKSYCCCVWTGLPPALIVTPELFFCVCEGPSRRASGDTSARWPVPSTRRVQPATTRQLCIPQPRGIGAHERLVTRRPLTSLCRYQCWYLYLVTRQSRDPGRLPACALFGLLGQDNLVSKAHPDGLHI